MSHHFDEDVISDLLQLKTKLTTTSLERKARISFRLIWSLREKIAIQLKTEQKPCAKRKAMSSSERKSEVLKKIAPGLDEEPLCDKSHIEKELVLKLNKREKKNGWNYCYADMIHLG